MDFHLKPFEKLPGDRQISGQISLKKNHLSLLFLVSGDLENLRWPAVMGASQRKDELWLQSCFEVFLKKEQCPGYVEANFSPSGDWNFFDFTGYRQGKTEMSTREGPQIHWESHSESEKKLTVSWELPSEIRLESTGVSCILETRARDFEYWALDHTKSEPDFHDTSAFLIKWDEL